MWMVINFRALVLWLLCHGVLPCFGQTNIHLEPTTLEGRCPGDVVTLTCTTTGSLILAWRSEEYIGPGGSQLELATLNNIGQMVPSNLYPHTVVATLIDKTSVNNEVRLISTLNITLKATFQTSSVTCVNANNGDIITSTITLLDEAEALSEVKSVLRREENDMCAVDLLWELPTNFAHRDISHFTVTINDEEPNVINETLTSASYTRCFCEPHNVTITLVDRCGRTGSSASVITSNATQSSFKCAISTTTITATTASDGCSSFDLNNPYILGLLIALITAILVIGIVIIILLIVVIRQWRSKIIEKIELDEEKKKFNDERKKFDDERMKFDDERTKFDDERKKFDNERDDGRKKLNDERKKLNDERNKLNDERKKLNDEKKRFDDEKKITNTQQHSSGQSRSSSFISREGGQEEQNMPPGQKTHKLPNSSSKFGPKRKSDQMVLLPEAEGQNRASSFSPEKKKVPSKNMVSPTNSVGNNKADTRF